MTRKAVIDIDNTLWQFCDVLYDGLREVNNAMPSPADWIDWDFWMHYCSEAEFMAVIHRIQMNQDNDTMPLLYWIMPQRKGYWLQDLCSPGTKNMRIMGTGYLTTLITYCRIFLRLYKILI